MVGQRALFTTDEGAESALLIPLLIRALAESIHIIFDFILVLQQFFSYVN